MDESFFLILLLRFLVLLFSCCKKHLQIVIFLAFFFLLFFVFLHFTLKLFNGMLINKFDENFIFSDFSSGEKRDQE